MILGPFPPPFGGVSVHISRLKHMLETQYDIDVIDESKVAKPGVVHLQSFKLLPYLKRMFAADIVHIQSGHYFLRTLHFVVAKLLRKKVIVSLHSYAIDKKGNLEKKIDLLIVKNSDKVICVNREIRDRFSYKHTVVREAFLPPVLKHEDALPATLENWIMRKKADGQLICCGNAWRLVNYNQQDLYGLDLFVEIAKQCRENDMNVCFVFTISDQNGDISIEKYQKYIEDNDLKDIFYLYTQPVSFVRIIRLCDVVIRPTNTDGDALTIREGLYYHKHVIASDVVERPQNTILFKNRSVSSLFSRLREIYELMEAENEKGIDTGLHINEDTHQYKKFYMQEVYN